MSQVNRRPRINSAPRLRWLLVSSARDCRNRARSAAAVFLAVF
ncbi:Uncharacterised protein [Bordetella pertussis]|nr:Uncharacterised protein [Bordetella pertussis]